MRYIEQEITIQETLAHANIIKLYKVFREGDFIHLLIEYASKGSLFDYTRRRRRLNDQQIAFVFRDICKAIEELHLRNILHRDLKPENILFDGQYQAKLADFGFACEIRGNERRRTICGTREYFSPEIFTHQNQTLQLDVWCLGVLLYELCHGKTPFQSVGKGFKQAAQEIKKQKYRFPFFFNKFLY